MGHANKHTNMKETEYDAFIAVKVKRRTTSGFEPKPIHSPAFDWQKSVIRWGSEGYASLRLGRRFVGSELKRSYFDLACTNLNNATTQSELKLTA
jgi:hypothetical protein